MTDPGFRGVYPYLVTPVDAGGAVKEAAARRFDVGDPIPPQPVLDAAARRELAEALGRLERLPLA